jgi:tetratricopeptide (TPR) repeat protein
MKLFRKKGTTENSSNITNSSEIGTVGGAVKVNNKNPISPNRKKVIILAAIALVLILLTLAIYVFIRQTKHTTSKIPDQQQKQLEQAGKKIKDTKLDANSEAAKNAEKLRAVETLVRGKKYDEAKKQLETMLESSPKSDDKTADGNQGRIIIASLEEVCIATQDFSCADKVVDYQSKNNQLDPYFLVAVARIAKNSKNFQVSRKYYGLALDYINKNGGEGWLKETANRTEAVLSYSEISAGAK